MVENQVRLELGGHEPDVGFEAGLESGLEFGHRKSIRDLCSEKNRIGGDFAIFLAREVSSIGGGQRVDGAGEVLIIAANAESVTLDEVTGVEQVADARNDRRKENADGIFALSKLTADEVECLW